MVLQQKHPKQHGAALITALLVVAIIVAFVSTLVASQHIAIRRTRQMLDADQAFFYALGVEDWAIGQLIDDWGQAQRPWPIIFGPTPIVGGSISGSIEDLQARFNLNNIATGKRSEFNQLLVGVGMSSEQANALGRTLAAWVNKSRSNEFVARYQNHSPPYQEAKQKLVSVSELRLIDGVSAAVYQALLPFVSALPEETSINVNTAPYEVLMTISGTMQAEMARDIIEYREKNNGIQDLAELKAIPSLVDYQVNEGRMTLQSQYFLAKAYVTLGKQQFIMYSLLFREGAVRNQQTEIKIDILWRSQGMY